MMENVNKEEMMDWELRPGGMLVQKRDGEEDGGGASGGPLIKITISFGSSLREVCVPAHSTFGELKKIIAQETGLAPEDQRLFFRGKEKEDGEQLHIAGLKNLSKLLLLEDQASKEKKLEEMKRSQEIARACDAVAQVRARVDQLSEKAAALEGSVRDGTKVAEKEFVVLTELLIRELLNLDGIEAEGEAKVHRKKEVRRVQSLVETLDALKARNSNPFGNSSRAAAVTTKWETFESGVGSLSAPPPSSSSPKITDDWEQFG